MTKPLRLHALDADDLAILSAHLQDAVIAVGDMTYVPRSKRFAFVCNRFDWIKAADGARERCRTGVHFESVTKVSRTGFDQGRPDLILNLLSIAFEPASEPAGHVVMTFSGGAALRLHVECVEAQLRDLGPGWKAAAAPAHPLDENG